MVNVGKKSVFLWLAMVCFCFRVFALSSSDELIREANQLLIEYKDSEALQKFEEVLIANPNHYEALHKISLLHSRIGLRYADESQKSEHFLKAKEYAEKALAINKIGAESNYVMALAISNVSFVSGAKARIASLKEIRNHLDIALATNPEYADAWQLLGRWYFKVANFNFLECTISKLLNGCSKEQASNSLAVACLKRAIELAPENLSTYYDLAVVYREMEALDESIVVLQKAVNVQPFTSEDLEISRRCKAMLSAISPS